MHHRITSWLLLFAFISLGVALDPSQAAANRVVEGDQATVGQRPNVVLILIDDLSHYGVTAYGANRIRSQRGAFPDQQFETPRIDELAREGLRVDYAFAHPICENTRVALMSGMDNDRNYLRPKSLHASDITFGDTFQRAGYVTGLFGKWKQSRGTRVTPGRQYISEFGWDEHVAYDVVTEGQRFINPNLVVNGTVENYTGRTDLDPATGRRWYGPDIVNRAALDFIDRHQQEPFFLYYSMMLVHDDHKPTPDTKPHSLFDQFDEANHNRDGHTGDDHHYFPDMLAYMDKLIGKVVDKLDALGLREETLIVVIGDNGTKESFAHLLPDGTVYPARKGGNADNGLHVPLVVNQPGTVPATQGDAFRDYDGLTDITDIYPTIADAAGVEIPNREHLDGISFWPQATGQDPSEHRQMIHRWFIGNYTYKDTDELVRFAFNKEFKRYAACEDFSNGRFFDLRTDLLERVGDTKKEYLFGVLRYSGLDTTKLTPAQQEAYDDLGKVLDANALEPVTRLAIEAPPASGATTELGTELEVGTSQKFESKVYPSTARRTGVVWESSNPEVATVNKFGEVTAHTPGEATITIYSWDDAEPLSNNGKQSYLKTGVKATQPVKVRQRLEVN